MLIVFPPGATRHGSNIRPHSFARLRSDDSYRILYWMIAAGIIGGLIAVPFGWIDWAGIPFVRYDLPEQPDAVKLVLLFMGAGAWASYGLAGRRVG